MIVSIEQVQNGVVNYIDNEVIPKASSAKKFAICFVTPIIKHKVAVYIDKSRNLLPELFDENGNVVIDKVYNYSKDAIRRSGQIEVYGMVFGETDIDKLYTCIKQTAVV